ncbi:DUF1361 domain-containing protein [Sediminibacterium soli]|uniref:DUF1361 domain-containing protein n=1 Tax=Sediminibacterium soli TaxID=2698829 RepID=UPI00137B1E54|nr:DUF1361 domain-containing protein [Sediminibacterium soli]NCI47530.1 DUF1361 domain-containing protein [Sediminibacterium soli]
MKITNISKLLLLSVSFTMTMLLVRFFYSHTMDYRFYGWNTFLAAIPYLVSTQLIKLRRFSVFAGFLLIVWLLFFPNAPYIITDLLHYEERPPVPFWYDILLVTSAAWNGLILGLVSLMNIEKFLHKFLKPLWVNTCVVFSLLLCGYGVFIGRFLRYNSWDIVTDPGSLVYASAHHVLLPQRYSKLWVFTLLFTVLLTIIYYTLKHLPAAVREQKE